MKKTVGLAVAAAVLSVCAGCASGPSRLSNSFGDWRNQQYSESAWLHALLTEVIPVYPLVQGLAGIGDLFVNAYYFWAKDAWDNKGTAYVHMNPEGAEKTVTGSGF